MIQDQFRALLPRAREVTLDLSAGQLNWRPAENAWSVAECIAHLNTTNEKYCLSIEKAIAEARREGLDQPLVNRNWGLLRDDCSPRSTSRSSGGSRRRKLLPRRLKRSIAMSCSRGGHRHMNG